MTSMTPFLNSFGAKSIIKVISNLIHILLYEDMDQI
jgi:hypothetical protein